MPFEYAHKVKYRTNKDKDNKFHTMTIKDSRKLSYSELIDVVSKKVAPKLLNYFDLKEVKRTR